MLTGLELHGADRWRRGQEGERRNQWFRVWAIAVPVDQLEQAGGSQVRSGEAQAVSCDHGRSVMGLLRR